MQSAERLAISELSEYGVSVDALAKSLQVSMLAFDALRNTTATNSSQDAGQDAHQNAGSAAEPIPQIPSSKDASYSILYNLIFIALKNVVVKTKELRYDARLRALLRRLSTIVFNSSLADGVYSSESEKAKIRSLLQLEIEHGAAVQIWNEISGSAVREDAADAKKVDASHSIIRWDAKWLAMGAAAVGGGVILGFTGGLAAPLLSAGLGSMFSYVGMTGVIATSIVEGLGTAGGAMAMATLFGVTGSSATAFSLGQRLKDLEDMDLALVFDHHPSLHVVIGISGFLATPDDVTEPWSVLPVYSPFSRIEALQFEPKILLDVGNSLLKFLSTLNTVERLAVPSPLRSARSATLLSPERHSHTTMRSRSPSTSEAPIGTVSSQPEAERSESTSADSADKTPASIVVTSAQNDSSPVQPQPSSNNEHATKPSMLTSLVSAIAWPVTLLQNGYIVDNPWTRGLDRAEHAGQILAKEILLARLRGHRPVTLIGFSLGANAIFHALIEVAKAGEAGALDAYAVIDSVILLGMPLQVDASMWIQASSVVNGRFVNGYAPSDWMLQFLCRTSGDMHSVAGLSPAPSLAEAHRQVAAAEATAKNAAASSLDSTTGVPKSFGSANAATAHYSAQRPVLSTSAMYNNSDRIATQQEQDDERLRSLKWIENADISSVISNHLDYLNSIPKILDIIGFDHPPTAPSQHATPRCATPTTPGASLSRMSSDAASASALGGDRDQNASHSQSSHSAYQDTLAAAAALGATTTTTTTHNQDDLVLFENPFADEDVEIRGIHAGTLMSGDGDSDLDDASADKLWTKRGADFGRMPADQDHRDSTSVIPNPLAASESPLVPIEKQSEHSSRHVLSQKSRVALVTDEIAEGAAAFTESDSSNK
eukprot:jgi/Hompol1/4270/HPOL_003584-RA